MKFLFILIYFSALISAGWYSPELYQHVYSGSCSTQSVVIYNEKNSRFMTRAQWFSEADGVHYRYSAQITRFSNGEETNSVHAERTFTAETDYRSRYVRFLTKEAFRISGPETTNDWPGAYIDPAAEKGFSASIYLFRTGDRWMQGFQGRPRAICNML